MACSFPISQLKLISFSLTQNIQGLIHKIPSHKMNAFEVVVWRVRVRAVQVNALAGQFDELS